MGLPAAVIKQLALECGFDLAGVASGLPLPEAGYFREWTTRGMAGEMSYLTDHRRDMRNDPRSLLPSVRSILCVGKLYNWPEPYPTDVDPGERGWISRYAWGGDYHVLLRQGLREVVRRLSKTAPEPFEWKICVDTAPLLERAYARRAGLGWIGKNTCLINQRMGSWFFLGELLLSLAIEADSPPPDRCGTCTLCIEACPTRAIVPTGLPQNPSYAIDSRLCISYLTIELRGTIPEDLRTAAGNHVFGCDVCQDVCPWNRKAPATGERFFAPKHFAPPLDSLASLSEEEFRKMFRASPVLRSRHSGFLRNVAVAMGNSRMGKFRPPLERLADSPEPSVAEHARWALEQLK